MKRLIVLCLFLLLPLASHAATERQEGQGVGAGDLGPNSTPGAIVPLWVGGRTADSVSTALRFDADGNLLTSLSNPPQSWYFKQLLFSNNLVVGNRDSSAVINTLGANHLYLYITVQPDSAIATASVWALQLRSHLDTSTDTLSSYMRLDMNGNGAGTANKLVPGTADTIGTATYATSAKTYAATDAWPGERIYAIPTIAHAPRKQVCIELTQQNGAPITAFLFSVRARLLGVYKEAGLIGATGRASITAYLVGTR